ncbi:hypothetical protein CSOJ01_14846 [Colletotrichum sojae]|uniref:Uncharacterized protein n=1 Tax=Colletotrichum sojae TaxID=2175907 RepID=A0A8H6IPP0_9PEZI|nr:hypothetical protein CSOJ01_14846 [Colletotrichum sojae]
MRLIRTIIIEQTNPLRRFPTKSPAPIRPPCISANLLQHAYGPSSTSPPTYLPQLPTASSPFHRASTSHLAVGDRHVAVAVAADVVRVGTSPIGPSSPQSQHSLSQIQIPALGLLMTSAAGALWIQYVPDDEKEKETHSPNVRSAPQNSRHCAGLARSSLRPKKPPRPQGTSTPQRALGDRLGDVVAAEGGSGAAEAALAHRAAARVRIPAAVIVRVLENWSGLVSNRYVLGLEGVALPFK